MNVIKGKMGAKENENMIKIKKNGFQLKFVIIILIMTFLVMQHLMKIMIIKIFSIIICHLKNIKNIILKKCLLIIII